MHADHMHNFSLLMISKNVTWGIIFKSDFTKKGVSGWTAVCFSSYSDARDARWAWLRPSPFSVQMPAFLRPACQNRFKKNFMVCQELRKFLPTLKFASLTGSQASKGFPRCSMFGPGILAAYPNPLPAHRHLRLTPTAFHKPGAINSCFVLCLQSSSWC